MPTNDTVVLCSSPKAGSGRRRWVLAELEAELRKVGLQCISSSEITEIQATVANLLADGRLRCVVAAGGDGTLALLAQSLPSEAALLPLPLGTENLLARHYGHSWKPAEVCRAIKKDYRMRIDAGDASGRLFLTMATAGFDAEVTRVMHLLRRGHIRRWSYLKPIWASIRSYCYPEIQFLINGEKEPRGSACWAMLFNLPQYAMGLPLSPSAVENDGLLNLCMLQRPGILAGMRYLSWVLLRRHESLKDVAIELANTIELRSEKLVPYQLDGDFVGHLPVSIRLLPNRVTLLMPDT